MGLGYSVPVKCEICIQEYGKVAILEVFHHGNLGGHLFCIQCYSGIKQYAASPHFNNILSNREKGKTCCCCHYKNKGITSRRLLKVHWIGKFGNKIMCEKCIYNKKYRREKLNKCV